MAQYNTPHLSRKAHKLSAVNKRLQDFLGCCIYMLTLWSLQQSSHTPLMGSSWPSSLWSHCKTSLLPQSGCPGCQHMVLVLEPHQDAREPTCHHCRMLWKDSTWYSFLLVYGDGATQCTIYTQQLQPGLLVGTLGVSCTCSDGHVGHMANAGQRLGEGCNRPSAARSCLEYWEYHCKDYNTVGLVCIFERCWNGTTPYIRDRVRVAVCVCISFCEIVRPKASHSIALCWSNLPFTSGHSVELGNLHTHIHYRY